MDAHTLNAWTRFALQKGGIGSCTALIDNPATEPEDLMFMTGERIIVLRRLEDETDAAAKRKSGAAGGPQDADAWFLGYCEGVVGRFKGGHVQFHGKLKKPVLMRRSGVGSVRDSSTRPMSKSEAASLHASQVPPGIPVTALGSDGEEDTTGATIASSSSAGAYATGSKSNVETSRPSNASSQPKYRGNKHLEHVRSTARPNAGGTLGVTTPPLSDEGHNHNRKPTLLKTLADDEDSDDSSSMLPWARHSRGSSAASQGQDTSALSTSRGQAAGALGGPNGTRGRMHGLATSNLPPSPISSNESPTHRVSDDVPNAISGLARITVREPSPSMDASADSRASSSYGTSTTDDSDDESGGNNRRDYTFSIYDVYGRDSVAFPNFDYRDAYESGNRRRVSRMNVSKSSDSLAAQGNSDTIHGLGPEHALRSGASPASGSSTPEPVTPTDTRRPDQLGTPDSSASVGLLPTSGRRPSAAPDPRIAGMRGPQNMASSLRRKVEASTPQSPSAVAVPGQPLPSPAPRGPGSFDPRRRPSLGNALAPPMNADPSRMPLAAQQQQQQQISSLAGPSEPKSPPIPSAQLSSTGSMRRPGFAEARERHRSRSLNHGPMGLQVDPNTANLSRPSFNFDRSSGSPRRSRHGTAGSPGMGPVRASSDRLSERERVNSGSGSGLLRKNPSNPTPGLHGGSNLPGLSPMARSGSPMSQLSAPNPTFDGPRRVSGAQSIGAMPRSPLRSPLSDGPGTPTGVMPPADMPLRFDGLGFVVTHGGPVALPQADDPEAKEKWVAILREEDSTAAKKSRKVKKLVRQGIPPSVRRQAWLFLANASVRRRVGLFEQLCKTSQGNKGKKGKESLYEAIEKDLDRSFPDHKLFIGESSTGKADLEAILKSYVHFNPIIGYTQGMGLLAGLSLIMMPAEDAFWLLCAVLRDPHMEGYYSPTMKQLHVDTVVFGNLLAQMDPELHRRLDECGIQPMMFTPSWLLPLFTRILPWNTLIRVWDVFFFEGPTWILRVALSIIRIIRDPLMDRRTCPGHGEMLQLLLHPPQAQLTPDNVLTCAFSVKLKDGEMRKLSRNASKLVREQNFLNTAADARGRPSLRRTTTSGTARSTSAPARRG